MLNRIITVLFKIKVTRYTDRMLHTLVTGSIIPLVGGSANSSLSVINHHFHENHRKSFLKTVFNQY
jgi:hypothetical protein